MQLETVYVLEGLGPPKDEAAAGRTFADQVLMPLIQPNACPVYTVPVTHIRGYKKADCIA